MLVARSVGRRDFFVGYGYGWEWISVTVLRVSHIHSGIPPDKLMACMWIEMDNILTRIAHLELDATCAMHNAVRSQLVYSKDLM